MLAQLYAQLLKDAGYSTSIKTVDNRELYEPSLEKGEIDVVPEYAATLAEFLNAKVNGPKAPEEKPVASSDVAATVAALEKLAGPARPEGAGRGRGGRPERLRGDQGIRRRRTT